MNAAVDILILALWAAAITWAVHRRPARRRNRPNADARQRRRSRPLGPRAGGALPSEHEFDRPRTIRTRRRR